MSRSRLNIITLGVMLSLFLASMEGTVVATAMPTIVGQLGGLSIYSWVFSVYLLASTTTVPIYGKLSDVYGRKLVFMISLVIFILGSVLCGQARSMEQLVFFRALQGLGAGGILPLAFTIIGELFSLEQRARMQGLFSGVWGVSAVIGPLIGGFLVDQISWQWVFYINVLPGLLAAAAVWFAWKDAVRDRSTRVAVDYLGTVLLTAGVLALLLGLGELGSPRSWGYLGAASGLFAGLIWTEKHTPSPLIPLHWFRDRLFTASVLHALLSGWAMFGSLAFVPLFVQAVLGTSATQAGISLTPMSLSWTLASIIGGPLLLKMGYRTLALIGMVLLVVGTFFMARIGVDSTQAQVMLYTGMMGIGMGLSVPAFMVAVQSTARKQDMGTVTSTVQFSRSIGGTLGVSVLGVFLSAGLARRLLAAGIDPHSIALEGLLDPVSRSSVALAGPLREALGSSIAGLFWIAFGAAFVGLLATLLAPPGKISQLVAQRSAENLPESGE